VSIHVGTSGWCYPWPRFYDGWPKKRQLEAYATRLSAVEINGSHYRLQKPETFEDWSARTPPDFVFTMKAHRYLTHYKRLIDPSASIAIDRDRALHLGEKLACVVWQLPRTFARDDVRLEHWLRALCGWPEVAHVFEPRHPSWMCDEVAARLRKHGVSACLSDSPRWPMWDVVTAPLVYLRLHGHTRLYRSRYSTASLERWARRIDRWWNEGRTVHVYFDNTEEGCAPRDAERLRALLALQLLTERDRTKRRSV
jgi:uncharacterized protein YecE (DUF72 family)